jgi:glycogen debranching enzyme
MLMEDWHALRAFLRFGAAQQGQRPKRGTGEEPGKIPHEIPDVVIERRGGRSTLYAACDTTALFLIGCEAYVRATGDREFIVRLLPEILWAFQYLRAHTLRGLFLEDPGFSRDSDFALWATYWRDSGIPGRRDRRLTYPVAFLVVQAQLIAALRGLMRLAHEDWFPVKVGHVEGILHAARQAFREHFDEGEGFPSIAFDAVSFQGRENRFEGQPIRFLATDAAFALAFLEPDDVSDGYRVAVRDILARLETPWGWKTMQYERGLPGAHVHHEPERIWPWEHAFIAEGLARHGMSDADHVALRPAKVLEGTEVPFSEYLVIDRAKVTPGGCHVQLWTVAYWSWVERRLSTSQNHEAH